MRDTGPKRSENMKQPDRIAEQEVMADAGKRSLSVCGFVILSAASVTASRQLRLTTLCPSGKVVRDMTSPTYKDCANHATAGKRQ